MAAALLESARKKLQSGALDEAMEEAKRAKLESQRSGDGQGVVDATCTVISVHVARGALDAAGSLAEEALRGFRASGDRAGEASMLWMMASVRLARSEPDSALDLAAEARQLLPQLAGDRRRLQAQVFMVVANAHLMKESLLDAVEAAEEALAVCRAAGDRQGEGEALHLVSMARLLRRAPEASRDPQEMFRAAKEALKVFKELGNREGEAAALSEMAEAQLAKDSLVEAVAAARQAMVIFRELQHWRGRQVTFDTIVQSYLAAGNTSAVVDTAQEELTLSRASEDREGEIFFLNALADIHITARQYQEAYRAATAALKLSKTLAMKDRLGSQFLVVSKLQQMLGDGSGAMRSAQEALASSEEAGNDAVAREARHMLSELYVRTGKPDLAPNREEAVGALAELTSAVEVQNAAAFGRVLSRLERMSGFTDEEIEGALAPALRKDRQGTVSFLRKQGIELAIGGSGGGGGGGAGMMMKELPKKHLYLNFRYGGLGYGPRFRTCRTNKVQVPGAAPRSAAVLNVQSCQEEWGKGMMFHPGIMDGIQHALQAMEMP